MNTNEPGEKNYHATAVSADTSTMMWKAQWHASSVRNIAEDLLDYMVCKS